jgi:hypothetical protein
MRAFRAQVAADAQVGDSRDSAEQLSRLREKPLLALLAEAVPKADQNQVRDHV